MDLWLYLQLYYGKQKHVGALISKEFYLYHGIFVWGLKIGALKKEFPNTWIFKSNQDGTEKKLKGDQVCGQYRFFLTCHRLKDDWKKNGILINYKSNH